MSQKRSTGSVGSVGWMPMGIFIYCMMTASGATRKIGAEARDGEGTKGDDGGKAG